MRIGPHDLDRRVFIVAEAGNNHEGSFARAEELVEKAAAAGADAIKFQTIVPEQLVSARATARLAQLERFRLSYAQFATLAERCATVGIAFLTTPFDLGSLEAMAPLMPAIKIASGDNDFLPLLEAAARTGKPVLLSTGMLDLAGVERAKAAIASVWRAAGTDPGLVLLHCATAYPTPAEEANLGALRQLARLGAGIGYSDHTLGLDAAPLAVALGARVIEKHFTLDKNQSEFRDHKLSVDPGELAELVRRIRGAEALLGSGVKRVMPSEEASLIGARRAIMAARDLPAGTVLAAADLTWLRPRREGLPPGREKELVGRRVAAAIARGQPILPERLG